MSLAFHEGLQNGLHLRQNRAPVWSEYHDHLAFLEHHEDRHVGIASRCLFVAFGLGSLLVKLRLTMSSSEGTEKQQRLEFSAAPRLLGLGALH